MEDAFEKLNISDCLNSNDENNPIKSVATVKHQMVRSPANFARLKCNTDLNIPPTNWLSSSFNSYGFQQALSQSTGFNSFRMAHLFPDCLGEVDVVSNAENIKRLLKLPYALNCTISMMVHRIGNTLLIDDFDVHRFLLQQEDCNWQWLKTFICENILTRLNDPDRSALNKQATSRNDAIQQKSLLSKFLYHSLSNAPTVTDGKDTLDVDTIGENPSNFATGPLLPEPEENVPDPKHTKHTYNRNVIWTFEDIRMLIGTDMAIFGGSTRPCISLRLRDMNEPINVLTGIDYWLDNLMCNVPEVVMCYHLDGLVQKYEIIKTEDLPFMDDSTFSPNVIRNVAQNILTFLKQNATKSGHTYWLFKGRQDDCDVVKLYDLTSLCTTGEFDCETQKSGNISESNFSGKDSKNPFTVPVAMLLYKVAKNMKNSKERIGAKQAGSIKELLVNCVKLLAEKKYPQIVTSSYFLLADLHIPTGIDPVSPEEIIEYVSAYDEQNTSNDSLSDSVEDEHLPPPLTGNIDERCYSALQYIFKGLNCLQYFSMNEAKLSKEREEIEKQDERIRIIQEEQNPNIAKRHQAIPLPYNQIKRNSLTTEIVGDVQQFQRQHSSTIIQSWNVHLKLLLVEKTCTIYAILAEQAYQHAKYGCALKFLATSLKCYNIVCKQLSKFSSVGTNLLGRSGDCYFQCAQHFSSFDTFADQYDKKRDIDIAIERELQKDCTHSENNIEINCPTKNVEQLILNSISCYEVALKYIEEKNSRNELHGRIGSVLNELGVKYMHWSQEAYRKCSQKSSATKSSTANLNDKDNHTSSPKTEPLYVCLAKKSYDCLIRGISIFEKIKDNANLAILLCNLGRFMRFRAHLNESKEFSFKKVCYENAFTSYQRALTILESKKQNSKLWDLVTWELSSGKLTLGKLMMEFFADEINANVEQEIIDLFLGSLRLCDTQTRGPRQNMYFVRSGLIYKFLGNIYSQAFKNRGSETNRKKKQLNLSRLYYEKSVKVFQCVESPFEYLGVQIERLELQSILFDGAQTISQKCKSLNFALCIACESIEPIFGKIEKFDNNTNSNTGLLKQFEVQIHTTLKHLIQIAINNKSCDASFVVKLKRLYSVSLQSQIKRDDFLEYSQHLRNVLRLIKQSEHMILFLKHF